MLKKSENGSMIRSLPKQNHSFNPVTSCYHKDGKMENDGKYIAQLFRNKHLFQVKKCSKISKHFNGA